MKHALSIAIALSLVAISAAADKASVADLLKSKKFDKKVVTVTGTVAEFKQKGSEERPYFLFKLKDGDKLVNVFGHGKAKDVKDGAKVEVTGEFAIERKSGAKTYKNEIDCSLDKKPNAVKVVK